MQDRLPPVRRNLLATHGRTIVRVKNGPDALEMGCLYYPRKQTSVGLRWRLRCQGGRVRSGYNNFLYARAATWVDATMLRADQQPLPHAVDAKNSVAALLLLE